MGKRNFKNNQIYANALPVTLSSTRYGALPQLYVHNPISWVYFLLKYIYIQLQPIPEDRVEVLYVDGVFKVLKNEDIMRLWTHGFFGKGSLSRSEPTWNSRINAKFGSSGPQLLGDLASEVITLRRREERKKFKALREQIETLELKQRKSNISEREEETLSVLKERLTILRKESGIFKTNEATEKNGNDDNDEFNANDETLDEETTNFNALANLEYLELQCVEVFFLKFALKAINVYSDGKLLLVDEIFDACVNTNPDFINEYVVYHHFRSLGWCVRSGIKFGCHMLLYNKGPTFSHAEFAIWIVKDRESIDWTRLFSVARVVGGVKKNLVMCYVKLPEEDVEPGRFSEYFQQCKVTEILYRRWIPNRTRD